MKTDRLSTWTRLLLDTGKRSNMINYRDTKSATAEVLLPDAEGLYAIADRERGEMEIIDPKLKEAEVMEAVNSELFDQNRIGLSEELREERIPSREEMVRRFGSKVRPGGSRILVYNAHQGPVAALKYIAKKARLYTEQTGINIAHMAFGLIHWFESDARSAELLAPILLVPIRIRQASAAEPVYIKASTDDAVVNPTFDFKLRTEYGISLPEFHEEEGLNAYFDKLRALLSPLGFTVTPDCRIGTFSFTKINMYTDLVENRAILEASPTVGLLLGETTETDVPVPPPSSLSHQHNVVDADESQAQAIALARSGHSFVLQGPPGTGKSQTITNMIAECLAAGKKVLFVSEKLAALHVVYSNLKRVGLEEFCLELYDKKTNKKELIMELANTCRMAKSSVNDRAERELSAKEEAMAALDAYAKQLHLTRPVIELSLYQIYEAAASARRAKPLCYTIPALADKGQEHVQEATAALERYGAHAAVIGEDYRRHPWYGFLSTDGSGEAVRRTEEELQLLRTSARSLKELSDNLQCAYGLPVLPYTDMKRYDALLALAEKQKHLAPALLAPDLSISDTVERLAAIARPMLEQRAALDAAFTEGLYTLDGSTLKSGLLAYENPLVRLFSGNCRAMIRSIALYQKQPGRLKYKEALSVAHGLFCYQEYKRQFAALSLTVRELLSAAYQEEHTDFAALLAELSALDAIKADGLPLGRLSALSSEEWADHAAFARLRATLQSASVDPRVYDRLCARFDPEVLPPAQVTAEQLYTICNRCLEGVAHLGAWQEFLPLLGALDRLALRPFLHEALAKGVEAEGLALCYKRLFYLSWGERIYFSDPALSGLPRLEHDGMVQLFREKDQLHFEINKAKINAVLSRRRPAMDVIAPGSEAAVLIHEASKKKRHMGVRRLLTEIWSLALDLKPCFLMSPLSVSTFLGPAMTFDVVIFDEASQIFPQDALGAIYRAKQMIVVGDSLQMPPSNFFHASVEALEEESDTDYESILDLCSVVLPQRRLRWHYRSRYEQLISFSNQNFYHGELVTFPSAKKDRPGIGIDYFHVDGLYDRDHGYNQEEARFVVELVFENLRRFPERSLGVVAFGKSQEILIDHLITQRRRREPALEHLFRTDRPEPFFVKSLESVQGDERDTIIFSTAYGKGTDGRLLRNFGPINQLGGERRLNVAVTRAKCNVQLVSSMHHTDIPPKKGESRGVQLLRAYLDYAENGEAALARMESTEESFAAPDTHLEEEICEFLTAHGFTVDRQVGLSSIKVDLAVKVPGEEDYLLAVECDGPSYHNTKTTRDRDRLRREVLGRMGWRHYRIWSTDWFRSGEEERAKLLRAVTDALQNMPEDLPAIDPTTDFEQTEQADSLSFPTYTAADIPRLCRTHKTDRPGALLTVLELEAPVAEEWLLRRLRPLYQTDKVNYEMRRLYLEDIHLLAEAGYIREDGFLVKRGAPAPMLRVPAEGEEPRAIPDIHPGELAEGLWVLLCRSGAIDKDGLFSLAARLLGFTRVGEAMTRCLDIALTTYLGQELVHHEDGKISLLI